MIKIVVNKDAFKLTEMELKPGTTSIGRNSDNDVHLDDNTVSGKHAKIVTLFSSSYVEDLGSTNGTFVNGNKVKTHTLRNGDVLTVGNYRILFEAPQESNSESENESTVMMDRSQLDKVLAPKNTKESVSQTKELNPKTVGETRFDKSTVRNEPQKSTITGLSVNTPTQPRPTSKNPAPKPLPTKSYPRSRITQTDSIRATTKRKIVYDQSYGGPAIDRNRHLNKKSNRSSLSREIVVVVILAMAIIAATFYALF